MVRFHAQSGPIKHHWLCKTPSASVPSVKATKPHARVYTLVIMTSWVIDSHRKFPSFSADTRVCGHTTLVTLVHGVKCTWRQSLYTAWCQSLKARKCNKSVYRSSAAVGLCLSLYIDWQLTTRHKSTKLPCALFTNPCVRDTSSRMHASMQWDRKPIRSNIVVYWF
jgi:hypothetical protein